MSYVLITPAKNEANYIQQTIQAVVQQHLLPKKWMIVSDGSTDGMDEIVRAAAEQYSFIHFIRIPVTQPRDFSSKIHAFLAGYRLLQNVSYDFIGNLDADVTFDSSYYQNIIHQFNQHPRLGVAGGTVYDIYDGKIHKVQSQPESVFGAVQLFRRSCFEQIGGLQPVRIGGEDTVAEVLARKNQWITQTFSQYAVYHHRRTGMEGNNILTAKYKLGVRDYLLGYHPLFFLLRCAYRLIEPPYILGSMFRVSGYCASAFQNQRYEVSDEFVQHIRSEQINRLKIWKYFSKEMRSQS